MNIMKRVLLFLFLTVMGISTFAQTTYEMDFEGMELIPSDIVLVNVDGATPNSEGLATMADSAWVIAYNSTFQSNIALGVSYYEPEGGADDWMILPKVAVNDGDVLEWDAMSLTSSGNYKDDYEVYVSTTTQDVAGCQANPVLLTVEQEEASKEASTPGLGVQHHKVDLSAYAGQEAYIAFRLMTPDPGGDRLAIDNIRIGADKVAVDENFDTELPASWTVIDNNNDGRTFGFDDGGYGVNGTNDVSIDTYDADTPGPSDDYLITPQFTVNEGDVLTFFAASASSSYPDNVSVLVSKTGTAVADFTINLGKVEGVPSDFTKYQHQLAGNEGINAGDVIYVAFYCDSEGSHLNIDDVKVGPYVAPKAAKAYCTGESTMNVIYDAAVSESDIDVTTISLSGTEDITFSEAKISGDDPTIVELSGASAAFTADNTLDVLHVGDVTVDVYAGILPLTYTSLTNPDGTIDVDGAFATFKGIVSAVGADAERVWIADAEGAHHGVNTYGMNFTDINVGDEILLYGQLSPYKNQTEIYKSYYLETLSTGNTPHAATAITGSEISNITEADTDPAEQYEGVLVTIKNAVVKNWDGLYFMCSDDDTYNFYVAAKVGLYEEEFGENSLEAGKTYDITGIVVNYDGDYVLNPRNADDIVEVTSSAISDINSVDVSIYPNPAQNTVKIVCNSPGSCEILDMTGRAVKKINLNTVNEINISDLMAGTYFVRIETGKNTLVEKLVVK